MATIKCKSCGRAYNYRSSELCPKCGAFNRPPHRMRVGFNADGGVELQTEKEFVREAQRFDARDDVCAEGQARKVRSSDTLIDSETLDALGKQLNKWGGQLEKWWTENSQKSTPVAKDSPLRDRKKGKSSGGKSALAVVIAISIFASLIGSITESCSSNLVSVRPEPDYSIPVEEVAPSAETWGTDEPWWTEEDKKNLLTHYGVTEVVGMGTVFDCEGQNLWVNGYEVSGEPGVDMFMVLSLNSNGELPASILERCFLVWSEDPMMSWTYYPASYQDGALIFYDLQDPVYDNTRIWLLCESFQQGSEDPNQRIGATAVELTEDDADASQNAAVEVWSEEEQKELLSFHDVTEEYSMGSGFIWQDTRVGIYGWGKDDSTMDVSIDGETLSGEELLDTCYLLWYDIVDGEEHIYHPDSCENGALIFKNIRSEILDTTYIWLIMQEGYILNTESNTMENIGTIAVRLN